MVLSADERSLSRVTIPSSTSTAAFSPRSTLTEMVTSLLQVGFKFFNSDFRVDFRVDLRVDFESRFRAEGP